MILILSDDYFFIEGLTEIITFTPQSCCNIFVSNDDKPRIYVRQNNNEYCEQLFTDNSVRKTVEKLAITEEDICIVAFENSPLIYEFSEVVSSYTKKAIIVHDTRIDDILVSLTLCGFVNKHAGTYDFLNELRNFNTKMKKGISLNFNEQRLLELYTSGTSVEEISISLGNSVKSCYGKKYALLNSNGFNRSNAYSVLLFEKLSKTRSFFS
ncbi:hypothetical protein O1E46_RS22240 [Enterobacter hormaechei]